LQDASGTVVQSLLVNIPMDSSRINLNFALLPGVNYSLTTNGTVNMQTLGTNTPRLQRSSQGVAYPYSIPGLVSITGSNQGGQYYYYFYDWELQEPSYICVSDRVPVVADITTGLNSATAMQGIIIYPNPASYLVNIELNASGKSTVELIDVAGRIVRFANFENNGTGKVEFDLTGIAKGSYNIRIKNGNGEAIRHLSVN
jgi:Secretion system C-terminal sorting domain